VETIPALLPPISILAGLSEKARELLSKESGRSIIPEGEFIVREGESGNRMFMIESGHVRICKRCPDATEVQLALLGPNDSFGEGCILTTLPRVASAQAVGEVVAHTLSSITFYHLYRAMPEQYSILILNIARDLARRLQLLDERFAACQ